MDNLLSPIAECNSEQRRTITDDMHSTSQKDSTIGPTTFRSTIDNRKLTGKGNYDIDTAEYDQNEYSDDFESYEDDEFEEDDEPDEGCMGGTGSKKQVDNNQIGSGLGSL